MPFDETPRFPRRRRLRLRGYDYADMGAYFITISAHRGTWPFGTIASGRLIPSEAGATVDAVWQQIPGCHPHVALDAYVVMPNHFHGILVLEARKEADELATRRRGIPEIVRGFKSFSAVAINRQRDTPGQRVWHRSYHDRIIRDGAALERAREYIARNPARGKG
jgi:putative transposase